MGTLVKVEKATEPAEAQQYLTFSLGSEMFAVGTLSVKEIIEYGQLTFVPMVPDFIRGVINLRGDVVPVIDLGARTFAQDEDSCVVYGMPREAVKLGAVDRILPLSAIPGAIIGGAALLTA